MWYTIYSLIGTIIEQAALFIILRWGLAHFNIHVPLWGIAILMIAFLVYSFYTYRMGRRALNQAPLVASETIIGCAGIVTMPLDTKGYVKVKGELWKASSQDKLEIGDDIEVIGMEGMRLIVVPRKQVSQNKDGGSF